jgi:hypothetical protein
MANACWNLVVTNCKYIVLRTDSPESKVVPDQDLQQENVAILS